MSQAFVICLLLSFASWGMVCGVSIGYPPYQYLKEGKPAGIDPAIMRLYNRYADNKISIQPMEWDKALSKLYYSKDLDCVWGMEADNKRREKFSFSSPIYHRDSSLFVLAESGVGSIPDLKGQVIVGDKDSLLEDELRGKYSWIRIRHAKTKAEAMQMLKSKQASAVVMPSKVAIFLAKKLEIDIEKIYSADKTMPVVVAVKKERKDLLAKIEKTLRLIPKKELEKILKSAD